MTGWFMAALFLIFAGAVFMLLQINPPSESGGELPAQPPVPTPPPLDINTLIQLHTRRTGLSFALIYGVMMTESSGNPNARNVKDPSSGLMGVTPMIGRAFANLSGSNQEILNMLLDPQINMLAGTNFLAHLRLKYSTRFHIKEWVQAYNLGETKFDRGYRNTNYGARVIQFAEQVGGI